MDAVMTFAATPQETVNFLPSWYGNRVKQEHANKRRRNLIILLLCGVLPAFAYLRHYRNELHYAFENQMSQVDSVRDRVDQITKFRNEEQLIAKELADYKRVFKPINYSRITGTMGRMFPAGVSLKSLDLETQQKVVAKSRRSTSKLKSKSATTTRQEIVFVELQGMAPSDIAIANMIGMLHDSNMFSEIDLDYSRQGSIKGVQTRDFKLSMQVPLNREYVPSDMEEAEFSEVAYDARTNH